MAAVKAAALPGIFEARTESSLKFLSKPKQFGFSPIELRTHASRHITKSNLNFQSKLKQPSA
ncbi:MAG: hypothetical protein A3F35_02510 [Candidatus Woykebacteria bacterium RIFCSPHIGHO2_12_FULL_45_10]|uniref:Uncharacterized protein n=1 Tax=Candidatus Woykebacteria bacterium RIFCSPHIGHO2_12_FULL_45_10 TaxID=1802603 RepID=A0A1G1WQ61_9BACT|nr:MAG: hypothetical protein A3F35_02510 [Candidatus Woykebacteria bacterium RIFCSPHIGHO2_12_FULL_45_10]